MIIACAACGSKYKYDESKLQGNVVKKLKCPKCKATIEVSLFQTVPQKPAVAKTPFDPALAMEQTYSVNPRSPAPPRAEASQQTDEDGPRTAQVKRDQLMAEVAVRAAEESFLKLPEYRRYSLAVIQGYNSGEIFQINKPRMIIGRMDADVVVKDLEASRQHARIDVVGDRVVLRDLNSTNGTFVNEQRITTMNLDNQQEFRIGTTVFMLIITELD